MYCLFLIVTDIYSYIFGGSWVGFDHLFVIIVLRLQCAKITSRNFLEGQSGMESQIAGIK
jgi:hypothetical protein